MKLKDLLRVTRSCRKFNRNRPVLREELEDMVDHTRYISSAANLQPLKYMLSWKDETNEKIFPALRWAGYLKDWNGPEATEEPQGYIIILGDTDIAKTPSIDAGISAQTIMLAAREKGLGACMIGAMDRKFVRQVCGIDERYEILLIIAIGAPAEESRIVDVEDSIKYWRDEAGSMRVPKRLLKNLIIPMDEHNP